MQTKMQLGRHKIDYWIKMVITKITAGNKLIYYTLYPLKYDTDTY